jgi:hypothetical protein
MNNNFILLEYKMKEKVNFYLNGENDKNNLRVVFKQPLLLKAGSSVEVKAVVVEYTPTAGYRTDSFAIQTDLPIKSFHSKNNNITGAAVEDRIIAFVPPAQNDESNGDDPGGGRPTIALRSYEPYQVIHHNMENNEISLNAINFQILDGNSLEPKANVLKFKIAFCIIHGDC